MNPNAPSSPGSPQAPLAPQGLIIGLLVAGAVLCALAFWAGANWNTWMQKQREKPARDYPVTGDARVPEVDEAVEEAADEVVEEEYVSPLETFPEVETWIDIAWYPIEEQTVTIREPDPSVGEELFSQEEYWPRTITIGAVPSGEFQGYVLTLEVEATAGMGMQYAYVYKLNGPTGDTVHLGRYNAVYGMGSVAWPNPVDANATYGIEELEAVTRIVRDTEDRGYVSLGAGARLDFALMYRGDDLAAFPVESYPIEATLTDGSVLREFTDERVTDFGFGIDNAFFTVREDGRLVWYDVQIPFLDGLDQPALDRTVGVPNVYLNTYKNTASYLKGDLGGCGFTTVTHVQSEDVIGEMEVIGYYVDGERVNLYAPADLTREYYQGHFETWQAMNPDGTMDQFEALVPFFYWKDSHGRWIEFMNSAIAPAVECGKPVIYLYPEETTDVTVKLWPRGGFTVTEPAYNGGWNVTASPDGTLVNKADGLTYPYLFWEGRGGLYAEPTRYWVVAREDVHMFLVDTLAKLGLNEQETADFLEFWEPRMQDAPYYQIGFHGNQVMDQLAPLSVSGDPDTIVRVLMDYQELDAWAPSKPPRLPETPVREGFTVIEWGGVLR